MFKTLGRLTILCLVFVLVACSGGAAPANQAANDASEAESAPAADAAPAEEEKEEPAPAARAEEPAPEVTSSEYQESPMLAEMVAAGELPPVDERLPADPFVVGPGILIVEDDLPNWEPGTYGGTLRAAHAVADWAPDVFVMMNEPLLISPGIGVTSIRGNMLKDFEVSDDNTEITFFMREGLKWSDGEPVTSEDIRFTYEDFLLNEQLTPAFPRRFRTGGAPDGEPMELEIVDDYTFKVKFAEPYGGFLRQLVIEGWVGYSELLKPAHFLKQFHIDYTTLEDMKPALDAAGLTDEWWQLFIQQDCRNWDLTEPHCAGFPVLTPWMVVEGQPGVLAFDRNPYYYKVDTEGKQLPYIDHIVSVQSEDVEAVNLKVLTGEVDFLRESTGLVKIPLYKENEEKGGFQVHILDMHVDSSALFINQTFGEPDSTWRTVSQDVRFRQALSLAINRPELIESIYFGFASNPLVSVGEEFSAYDPDRANQLLDEVGLDQRGSDGFRLGPDGEPFPILIEHGAHAPDLTPAAELVTEHLRDVGLDVQVKIIDSQLWGQRRDANELQATFFWDHDQNGDNEYTGNHVNHAGRLWNLWYTSNGDEGEEPPAWALEAFEIDKQRWSAVTGSDEYLQLKEQGYEWARTNLPVLTVVEGVKYPMIASSKLGNIPSGGYAIAANFSGEQLFFKEQ
jgi:peptide/nickel transport system substrate-binding protein